MGYMKRNSLNSHSELEPPTHKICGPIYDFDAWNTGVKWHHGAGHSSGRGVYLFWAKTDADYAALARLRAIAKERAAAARAARAAARAAKGNNQFASKSAAWRYIRQTWLERRQDAGHGSIEIKCGRYGWNLKYGSLITTYYFASAEEKNDLMAWIAEE